MQSLMPRALLQLASSRMRRPPTQFASLASATLQKSHRPSKATNLGASSSVGLAAATAAAAIGALSLSATEAATAGCESSAADGGAGATPAVRGASGSDLPPNPLWPSGVPPAMVDSFVATILADTDINITAIPDAIEWQIYVSTVQLTLNAVYEAVGGLHGLELLGHRLELRRVEGAESPNGADNGTTSRSDPGQPPNGVGWDFGSKSIDNAALEAVADRLLSNAVVNQPLVPDFVERQLYINCLKLVFHLLDAVASSLRVTVCGHDLMLRFEPCEDGSLSGAASSRWVLGDRAGKASSALTEVDLDAVAAFAKEVGAVPQDPDQSWLWRVLEPRRREFVAQLHTTLYALVLAIIDDLLEDTVLTFLSDRIRVDVVAKKGQWVTGGGTGAAVNASPPMLAENMMNSCMEQTMNVGPGRRKYSTTVPTAFALGVGVGAVLAHLAKNGRSA